MDANIQNVILGVVGNILTSFLFHAASQGPRLVIGEKTLKKWRKKRTSLEPILLAAINEVTEGVDWDTSIESTEICLFLGSPEVEDIVRQIYSALVVHGSHHDNGLAKIELEFRKLLSLHVNLASRELEKTSRVLMNSLISTCDVALRSSIDEGILAAHEARSVFRYQMLVDQLATIQRNVEFLTTNKKLNVRDILAFENEYRQQVAVRHGYITPPFVDSTKKIPIDDIYVSSDLIGPPKKKGEEQNEFERSHFLSNLYRAVLLGNPGGGKSTFASKLCYDIAIRYEDRLVGGRLVTPILVVLRDYGSQKKENQCSIIEFIEKTARSHYQIESPDGAFEYLLLNGRAVVIFDGLDELLETSYRQEISSDVETFSVRYPSAMTLVTSREVGYEQAPLDSNRFEIFRLAPFNDEQVHEYVTKWFAIEADLIDDQQQSRAFLRESQNVPDLRSNPLMLALMCNIYRGENYIPRNRPEVYQRCATMLFERWDKSRNILVKLPFEEHIRPAMSFLANWIYSDDSLQAGVTEDRLVEKTTEYLTTRRFEHRDEAQYAAREFIEFCRGRAWVFTDTGTTAAGERLYQFTHQTFLEYFAADYLVRTHPISISLVGTLLPKIARREWDIVAQLAFQIHHRRLEDAGDELLTALLDATKKLETEEQWNVLSFAVRCLEFIVPSPKVTRLLSNDAINLCLKLGHTTKTRKKQPQHVDARAAELVGYLLNSTNENRPVVADSLEKTLTEQINTTSRYTRVAVELGLNLPYCLHYITAFQHQKGQHDLHIRPELLEYWNEFSETIYTSCKSTLLHLSPNHFPIVVRRKFWTTQ